MPALLFAVYAQINVNRSFGKYSRVESSTGLTGALAAQKVLEYYAIHDVHIEHIKGKLTDHYDPRDNTIRLSTDVFSSTSVAAIGVACHEVGHAIQHHENYFPIKIRNAIIPVCNIGSNFGIPIALIGLFFNMNNLITFGLMLYSLIVVFQFITLPVEFNASARAIKVINEKGMLDGQELSGVRRMLTATAVTYVAALVTSLANLLRLILLFNRRNN
ncbi:hypothetical protein SDC9_157708 [bioreactor metagenome]|uniref:Peptidase n=1 Tax=bioreactor metagenome TaxID=1076179 RepID=A0A645FDF0_9ZZZZ